MWIIWHRVNILSMKFQTKLLLSLQNKNSSVCVGLDSRFDRIPAICKKNASVIASVFSFNKQVIEATQQVAAAYKMNVAFYAGFGADGLEGLRKTTEFLKKKYPDIPLIADCKRSEMGESVQMVKQEIFDWLGFDCIMVTPWFGFDTIAGYLDDESHGVCVYVHDSNPSAKEFQDLELKNGRLVYEEVTHHIVDTWNKNGNVFVEAGATYPRELRRVREIIGPDMPLLVAGIGAQGGTIENLVGLFGKNGQRLLVNSSRGIIFAGEGKPDYFEAVHDATEKLRDQLLAISLR